MFCEKCGAQLPDTAGFCNKCGNTLRKKANVGQTPVIKTQNYITNLDTNIKKSFMKKKDKGFKGIFAIFIFIIVIAIVTVVGIGSNKIKTSIYGTWTDANKTMTFTFDESGKLRVSGSNNILGADVFSFVEEDGELHLQVQGLVGSAVEMDIKYELSGDNLNLNFMGQDFNLYRATDSDVNVNWGEDSVEDVVENFVEEALDTVQIISLYGTWTDSYGAVSFTFYEDGKIRISGLEDSLGVDMFTFTEVDDDTLQLKAESANPIVGAIGVNLDYEITGDTMTVSIAGQTLKLVKKD